MAGVFDKRLKGLQRLLKEKGCDAFIVDDPIDIYYLTGCEVSTGTVIATQRAAKLIVDSRYFESCKKNAPFSVLLSDKKSLTKALPPSVAVLGFDSATTPYERYLELRRALKERKIRLRPLPHALRTLRRIKDKPEIALLKKAAKLGSAGFDFLCSFIQKGITELEMAAELEIFWKREGSKGLAFEPIIAFGAGSAIPHYKSGPVKLKKGDAILIDIGVNLNHYNSDMTRVLFFGRPKPKLKKVYEIVWEAQERALELCKPGTPLCELDRAARRHIKKSGFEKEFCHSLGHGVGLEIHEAPRIPLYSSKSKERLEEGMVVTVEPGIYLPGVGGIRIEDTVLITKNGHQNLTDRPKEPRVIE